MKHFPISVWISMVILLIVTAITVWTHPLECLQMAAILSVCAAVLRVAYFVIEGE